MSRRSTAAGTSRRAFLRGLGVTVALPTLESLARPARAGALAGRLAETTSGMPLRAAFVAFLHERG